jgi:lactoylglutathione lyase
MIRVGDLEKSKKFYTEVLGLKFNRQNDYPEGKFTLAFLGTDEQPEIYATCKKIEAAGGKVVRPPGPMKHGTTVIAFIEDPDSYKIELIERPE